MSNKPNNKLALTNFAFLTFMFPNKKIAPKRRSNTTYTNQYKINQNMYKKIQNNLKNSKFLILKINDVIDT